MSKKQKNLLDLWRKKEIAQSNNIHGNDVSTSIVKFEVTI
jgi:hypothetical protein